MRLRTYNRDAGLPIAAIDREVDQPLPELEPGLFVEVPGKGGLGTVIAVNDEQVSVLWSRLPPPPHDGSSYIEAGYVYAPHVPLQVTPTVFNPNEFQPRKGVMTRYSKKLINSSFYGTVSIKDLKS